MDQPKIETLEKAFDLLQTGYTDQLEINKNLNAKVDKMAASIERTAGMLETMAQTGSEPTSPAHKSACGKSPVATATAPPSQAQAPTYLFKLMATNAARRPPINFEGAPDWDCNKFVKECVSQRQDPDQTGSMILGNSLSSTNRCRLKKVYKELNNQAPADKKKYFKCGNMPAMDLEGLHGWLKSMR